MLEQDEDGMLWASRLVKPDELTPIKYADSDWRGFREYKKDEWIYSDCLKVKLPNRLIRVVYLRTGTGETAYLKEGVLQKLPRSASLLVRNLLLLVFMSFPTEGSTNKSIRVGLGVQNRSPLLSQEMIDMFQISGEVVNSAGLYRFLPVVDGPGTTDKKSKKEPESKLPDFSKVKNDSKYFLKCVSIDW